MRIIYIFFLLSVFCEVKTQSIDTLFVFLNNVNVNFRSQKIEISDFEKPEFCFTTFPRVIHAEQLMYDTLSDGRVVYKRLPGSYDKEMLKVMNYREGEYASSLKVGKLYNSNDSMVIEKPPYYYLTKFQLPTYFRQDVRGCYVRRSLGISHSLIFYSISSREDTTELSNLIQNRFNNNSLDPCFKNANIKPCPMKVITNEKLVKMTDNIRFNLNYIELIPYKKDAALEVNQFNFVNEELIQILNSAKVIYLTIGNPQSNKSRFNKVSFQYNQENISPETGNCNIPFTSPSIL